MPGIIIFLSLSDATAAVSVSHLHITLRPPTFFGIFRQKEHWRLTELGRETDGLEKNTENVEDVVTKYDIEIEQGNRYSDSVN